MLMLLLRRIAGAIPTLFLLCTLTFFLMRVAPGGPFDRERQLPPAVKMAIEHTYHVDEPLLDQYVDYLKGLVHGDLGPSFQYENIRVTDLIVSGAPVSMLLGALAIALALPIGLGFGISAALRQGGAIDRGLMMLAVFGLSIPSFVIAPALVLLFAIVLGWLPAGGWARGQWSDMVMPVIALALPQVAAIARLARGAMIEALGSDFVRTARAKGLGEARVILVHAIKPALLPVLSYLGPAAAGVMTGSVVVEQIFGIPGIGRYFVKAALNRDYTLVLGVVLFYGALIVVFNFIVDVLYGVVDPRIRPR
jgi:oligopeptide transport system permease protein